jgi:hypothetical protein
VKRYILLAVAIAILASHPALACSCVEYLSLPGDALEKSGLVFSGQVESVEVIVLPRIVYTQDNAGPFVASQYLTRRAVVTFRVLDDWKGTQPKRYRVLAGAPPETPLRKGSIIMDCDVHFEVGKQYLVFTTFGYADANPCAPTAALKEAGAMVEALNKTLRKAK